MAHPGSVPIETLLRHRHWVRALARSLVRDEDAAEDLEQGAWLASLRSPPRAEEAVKPWFRRVLRGLAVDRFRSESRRRAREDAAVPRPAADLPDEVVGRAEAHRRVVEAVMALEEPYRTTILLRFFEDLPPAAVAARTGVPAETVRTRTRRALERLRGALGGGDGDRRGLALLLAPLLGDGRASPGIPPGAGAALGAGVAMATGHKTAVAAVVLLLLAGGAAWLGLRDGGGEGGVPRAAPGGPQGTALETPGTSGPSPGIVPVPPVAGEGRESPAPPPPARLRVRRGDGGPVAGALVLVYDASGLRFRSVLDGTGRCPLPPFDRDLELAVALPATPLFLAGLPAGPDPREVVLPAGAAVEGTVQVDGAVPEAPVRLSLLLPQSAAPPAPVLLPDAVREALGPDHGGTTEAGLATGPGGRFRFEGLPAGAAFRIGGPFGLAFEDGALSTAGRVPAEGLLLRFRRLPSLRGRLVFPGGAPAAGGSVSFEWRAAGSGGTDGATAGADGRFEVILGSGTFDEASLRVAGPGGLGARTLPVEGPCAPGRDLGDLVVGAPWEKAMRLRAVDAEGRPVAGAVAFLPGPGWASPPSGPDGLLLLPGSEAGATALVAAPGLGPAEATVSPTAGEPAEVTLRPAPLLVLRASGPGGVPPNASIRLSSPDRFLDPRLLPGHAFALALAGTESRGGSYPEEDGEGPSFALLAPGAGPVPVPGVLPRREVRVELLGPLGEPLAAATVRLEPGERREVPLAAPRAPRVLAGAVRDEAGRPLPGARVTVSLPGEEEGGADATWTGSDGRFSVPGLYAAAVRVRVDAPGRVPVDRPRVEVPAAGDALAVDLLPGRTVRVRVEDAAGAPLAEAAVRAALPGGLDGECPWWGEAREAGVFEIGGLPSGEVEIAVECGEAEKRFRHDTARPEAVVVLAPPDGGKER